MKVVKTHSNWKLHKRGYPVAFRFADSGFGPQSTRSYTELVLWLRENRGQPSHWDWQDDGHLWTIYQGRAKSWRESIPYFIGLKDETDVSIILLSIGDKL